MIKNNLVTLLEYRSPLNYPILTPLVSFISLCASFEASLIHPLGSLNLTDIDHVSIMKSSVSPTPKRGGITGKGDPKQASVHRNWTPPDSYISNIGLKSRRYKKTNTRQCRTVFSHKSYVNLRTSRKKTSPLIASLSVLSVKLHYI